MDNGKFNLDLYSDEEKELLREYLDNLLSSSVRIWLPSTSASVIIIIAYRALRQSIPEGLRTGELEDLIAWLGEITRLVDSSLLDEWNELAALAGFPPSSGPRWLPRHGPSRATNAPSG